MVSGRPTRRPGGGSTGTLSYKGGIPAEGGQHGERALFRAVRSASHRSHGDPARRIQPRGVGGKARLDLPPGEHRGCLARQLVAGDRASVFPESLAAEALMGPEILEAFEDMAVFDCLVMNVDRHSTNFALGRGTLALQIKGDERAAPCPLRGHFFPREQRQARRIQVGIAPL